MSTRFASAPFRSRPEVAEFVARARAVFVVEQNRDAQMRTLLMTDLGDRSGAAYADPPLRRDADHRPLHRPRDRRPVARARGAANTARPSRDLSRPSRNSSTLDLPVNALGFTHRDYEGSMSTLVRRLRPRFDQRGDHPRLLRAQPAAASHRQAQRHRLLLEDPDLHARPEPRLQFGARAHALGADRRQSRQPRPHLSRRLRRRRHRLDRPRPVRPCDAARRRHGLYRREQRRLRPDQGPVLGHRRPRLEEQEGRRRSSTSRSISSAWRSASAPRSSARSFSGDKDAARAADQGGVRASRRGVHRRHLALRGVQQPRRLDQELRLCARAQFAVNALDVIIGHDADRDRLRGGRERGRHDARRLDDPSAQARRRTTIVATARRRWPRSSVAASPARSSPASSISTRTPSNCTTASTPPRGR